MNSRDRPKRIGILPPGLLLTVAALCLSCSRASGATASGQPAAAPSCLEIDLASDTAWTLHIDGGPARPIKVTAGGWNSDQQSPRIPSAAVKDHVVYERQITIPAEAKDQAVKIQFGGCTYGAEVWLDDKKVAEHHTGPMTPFEADLTGIAEPGKTHRLRVTVFTRMHYGKPPNVPVPFDFNQDIPGVSKGYNGHTKFAYGLTGSTRLVVLPTVHVSDVFVRPSVTQKLLSCDVWISNGSKADRKIQLAVSFSSWNGKHWEYPAVPSQDIEVPAGKTVKMNLPDIPWTLGPESYWWPNVPFREEYQAQLHYLHLTTGRMECPQTVLLRFGFVEHGEGPFYYTVNGVRVTGFSDSNSYGQIGEYDCWTETPCFQPPHGNVKGCPETWKRYQRLGFNSMRLSTSVPTKTMLATADEAGYMLIPEGGSWGNNTGRFNRETFGKQVQDTIRACRNHPSVARYSLCNEPREKRDGNWVWRGIIDDAHATDPTRPLVMEVHAQGSGRVDGLKSAGHAFIMEHYGQLENVGEGRGIRGKGECDWGTDKLGDYAIHVRTYRLYDWAYFAPWSMVNFWPNLLEGMNHERHPWKYNNHLDRTDGVDGWNSPLVKFLQISTHPYLLQDLGILAENPGAPCGHKTGQAEWPYTLPTILAGQPVERNVEVFNGGLSGNKLTLRWSAQWDKPDGPVAVKGGDIFCEIEPGFHTTQTLTFTVPKVEQETRKLFLVLESIMDGDRVFRSEETCLHVITRNVEPAAVFLQTDDQTQGDWEGKFGADGYDLVGHESKLPVSAKFVWVRGKVWTYDKATADKRALAYFANPPTGKDRIAACRYGDEVAFTLDAGPSPRRLTLYFLDYDNKGRKQAVELMDAQTGSLLDECEVAEFAQGRYLSWMVQGAVKVHIRKITGDNASVSGIFLDADGK